MTTSIAAVAAAHNDFLSAQFASLPALPAVEQLSPRVIRILGGNPGKFQLQGTNTYLIGTGAKRILIDTAQGVPVWADTLKDVLAEQQCEVAVCLITHRHHDHVGGIPALRRLCPGVRIHKHDPETSSAAPSADDDDTTDNADADALLPIANGQVFTVEGATLTALHTPGHTTDHMSFTLSEEQSALFTGDNVLGHGTTVFEDLHAYIHSLSTMSSAAGEGARAYPAHGAVLPDARKKIAEYVRHRARREAQIVAQMRKARETARLSGAASVSGIGGEGGSGGAGLSSLQIVKRIYVDVDENLHLAAEHGTVLVLEKLEREGRVGVEEVDGMKRWYLTGDEV
ncbi:beta-lactamase-like protein [Geopyxis carbonaria]|nr:beta-lactamase-like protein [Geopyxis carbonaria]